MYYICDILCTGPRLSAWTSILSVGVERKDRGTSYVKKEYGELSVWSICEAVADLKMIAMWCPDGSEKGACVMSESFLSLGLTLATTS